MTSTVEPRSAWWIRALSALPLPALYGLASFLTFLAFRVVRYRDAVVRENLRIAISAALMLAALAGFHLGQRPGGAS